jgi:hypothetical protein
MSTGCATRSPHIPSGPRCLPKLSQPSSLHSPIILCSAPKRALDPAHFDAGFAGEHSMIGASQSLMGDSRYLAGQLSATVIPSNIDD